MTFRNNTYRKQTSATIQRMVTMLGGQGSQQWLIGGILFIALLAFEIFNFDTTRYALDNLLGGVTFGRLSWSAILAVAFCSIDFAGLARLFTPEKGADEPTQVWYLTGAWLLGATMNAVMTWWAISLTLLNHPLGNEVLGREQLLTYVPIFVAALVWVTRILFIGSIAVAGDHLLHSDKAAKRGRTQAKPRTRSAPAPRSTSNVRRPVAGRAPAFSANNRRPASGASFSSPANPVQTGSTRPAPARSGTPTLKSRNIPQPSRVSRVTRRPAGNGPSRPAPVMRAKGRN
ncbi:MAG: hypothetical protein AB8G95_17775 [Anaerolineae bacterium]